MGERATTMRSNGDKEPPLKRARHTRTSQGRPCLSARTTDDSHGVSPPRDALTMTIEERSSSNGNIIDASTSPSHEQPSQSDQGANDIDSQVERLSQISIHENSDDALNPLELACSKRPLLDGTFFALRNEGSDINKRILMICKFCQPENILKTSLRSTSSLTTHLQNIHPNEHKEYLIYAQSRRSTSGTERKRWSCTFSQENWERHCTAFVLEAMLPLHIVEAESFRRMFDDLNIKKNGVTVKHLSRYSLLKRIVRIVEEQRDEIKNVIERTKYVCTTADGWSGKNRRFLGVTLHWIDERTLERKSAAIACKRFPGAHTHDAIATLLSDIHASFGIDLNKLVGTVTDNAANFVKAFTEFGIDATETSFLDIPWRNTEGGETSEDGSEDPATEDLATVDEDFSEECERQLLSQHLRCASHTLNLIATTDTVKAISRSPELMTIHAKVMAKCNALWKSLRSPKISEAMKEYLGIALKKPIVTRWNSLFTCLKQLNASKSKLLACDGKRIMEITSIKNPLTSREYSYIEEYLLCTSDLANAIDLLQGESYCHYGYLLPTLVRLRYKLLVLKKNTQIIMCKPIIQATITALERRFESMFNLTGNGEAAAIAAISHPTFKLRWLSGLPESEQKTAYNLAVAAISAESTVEETIDDQPLQLEDDWDFGDGPMIFENLQPAVDHATSEVTLSRYIKDPDRDLKMLQNHPIIRKVFIKFNTPLPSSAPVERLFSYATMFDLPKYNRLTDDHFELRILAKVNASRKYI